MRALGALGRDAVQRPGILPGKVYGWFRKWLRKVWNVRGGGLYALGYVVTFVVLTVQTIVVEIAESSGVSDYVRTQIAEFVTRFAVDSLQNMIKAFMWPVYVVQTYPPYGLIALGAAFFLFPRYLKKHIEKWLFDEQKVNRT